MVALGVVDADPPHRFEGRLVLDRLGDGAQPHDVADLVDRGHQGGLDGVDGHVAHEAAVDLEEVQRQVAQGVAAGRSGFGVIHGVVHAAGVAGGGLIQLKTPEAAAAVFASDWDVTVIGLDVTEAVRAAPSDFARVAARVPRAGGFLDRAAMAVPSDPRVARARSELAAGRLEAQRVRSGREERVIAAERTAGDASLAGTAATARTFADGGSYTSQHVGTSREGKPTHYVVSTAPLLWGDDEITHVIAHEEAASEVHVVLPRRLLHLEA